MKDDQSDAFKNDCWATTNGYYCDDHLVIMKARQLDALKNDYLGTVTDCCNDDHLLSNNDGWSDGRFDFEEWRMNIVAMIT